MDQELLDAVLACQKGHVDSFAVVYDNLIKKIYSYHFYRLRHRQTAEDLTSLTMTKAFQNIKSFDPQHGSVPVWIYRIARNTLIDHYRTAKATSEISEAFDVKTETRYEAEVDSKAHLAKVREYLQTLPQEQRDLIIMRVWDELSYKEIAEVTGKTEAALKMSVSRILAKVRTQVPVAVLILMVASLN